MLIELPQCDLREIRGETMYCTSEFQRTPDRLAPIVTAEQCARCEIREWVCHSRLPLPAASTALASARQYPAASVTLPPMNSSCQDWKERHGAKEWRALHAEAWRLDHLADESERLLAPMEFSAYFKRLLRRIRCAECQIEAADYFTRNTSVEDGFFAWTVAFHSHVNRKLGKPEVSLENARALYEAGSPPAVMTDPNAAAGGSGRECSP